MWPNNDCWPINAEDAELLALAPVRDAPGRLSIAPWAVAKKGGSAMARNKRAKMVAFKVARWYPEMLVSDSGTSHIAPLACLLGSSGERFECTLETALQQWAQENKVDPPRLDDICTAFFPQAMKKGIYDFVYASLPLCCVNLGVGLAWDPGNDALAGEFLKCLTTPSGSTVGSSLLNAPGPSTLDLATCFSDDEDDTTDGATQNTPIKRSAAAALDAPAKEMPTRSGQRSRLLPASGLITLYRHVRYALLDVTHNPFRVATWNLLGSAFESAYEVIANDAAGRLSPDVAGEALTAGVDADAPKSHLVADRRSADAPPFFSLALVGAFARGNAPRDGSMKLRQHARMWRDVARRCYLASRYVAWRCVSEPGTMGIVGGQVDDPELYKGMLDEMYSNDVALSELCIDASSHSAPYYVPRLQWWVEPRCGDVVSPASPPRPSKENEDGGRVTRHAAEAAAAALAPRFHMPLPHAATAAVGLDAEAEEAELGRAGKYMMLADGVLKEAKSGDVAIEFEDAWRHAWLKGRLCAKRCDLTESMRSFARASKCVLEAW